MTSAADAKTGGIQTLITAVITTRTSAVIIVIAASSTFVTTTATSPTADAWGRLKQPARIGKRERIIERVAVSVQALRIRLIIATIVRVRPVETPQGQSQIAIDGVIARGLRVRFIAPEIGEIGDMIPIRQQFQPFANRDLGGGTPLAKKLEEPGDRRDVRSS